MNRHRQFKEKSGEQHLSRAILYLFSTVFVCAGLYVVNRMGLSYSIQMAFAPILLFLLVVATGVSSGTLTFDIFSGARGSVAAIPLGMASASDILGLLILTITIMIFSNWTSGIILIVGSVLGLLISTLIIVPRLQKSECVSAPQCLGNCLESRSLHIVAALIAFLASLGFSLAIAAMLSDAINLFFSARIGIWFLALVVIACLLPGGMYASIRIRSALYGIILLTLAVLFFSLGDQVAGSLILPEVYSRMLEAVHDFGNIRPGVSNSLAIDVENFGEFLPQLAIFLCVTCGIAVSPHFLGNYQRFSYGKRSRTGGLWVILFLLPALYCLPALPMLVKLDAIFVWSDTQNAALADWMLSLLNMGQMQICGTASADLSILSDACKKFDHTTIPVEQVVLSPEGIFWAAGQLRDQSTTMLAFTGIGLTAVLLATYVSLMVTLSLSLTKDVMPAFMGRQFEAYYGLLFARASLIGAVVLTLYFADFIVSPSAIILQALSLLASTIFPALILSFWWQCSSARGLLSGMVIGALISIGLPILIETGLIEGIWPPLFYFSGLIGAPTAAIAMLVLSGFGPAFSSKR